MERGVNRYVVVPFVEGVENPRWFICETDADLEGARAELEADGFEIVSIKPALPRKWSRRRRQALRSA